MSHCSVGIELFFDLVILCIRDIRYNKSISILFSLRKMHIYIFTSFLIISMTNLEIVCKILSIKIHNSKSKRPDIINKLEEHRSFINSDIIRNDYMNIIVDQISNNRKTYNAIVICQHANIIRSNSFVQKLSSRIATFVIDCNSSNSAIKLFHSKISKSQMSRSSAFYVLFENGKNFTDSYHALSHIVSISANTDRPKCLLLDFSEGISYNSIKNILITAWQWQFLDFSILHILDNQAIVYYYNPFTQVVSKIPFNLTTIIFPDKLVDGHEYTLKTTKLIYEPYLVNSTDFNGYDFESLLVVTKKLNFSLSVIDLSNINAFQAFSETIQMIENKMIDISPLQFQTNEESQDELVFRKWFYLREQHLFVPILFRQKVNVSRKSLIFLCALVVIICLYKAISIIFKFSAPQWDFANIFYILLRLSFSVKPKKSIERIIYYSLLLVSIFYTVNSFSLLLDLKVFQEEIPFDNYEDVYESGLPIVMTKNNYNSLLNDSLLNNYKWILSRAQIMYEPNCHELLIKNLDRICVMSKPYLEYIIAKYIKEAEPSVKISKIPMGTVYISFIFQSASPYAEQFDALGLKIHESGLQMFWKSQYFHKLKGNQTLIKTTLKRHDKSVNTVSASWLFTFLSVCCLISLVVFFIELILAILLNN